ncbi:MAG: type 4a pilus biogenesis protein PilO [Acidimicrobiia bacterium]
MRRTVLLVVLGSVLATAAWFLFVFGPASERIAIAEEELAAAEQQEVQLRAQLAQLRRVEENQFAYLTVVGALEAAVPPTPQLDVLIEDLKALSDDSGMEWKSMANGDPTEVEDTDYFQVPVSITLEGQYFELLGYLYGIADLSRVIVIESVAVTPAQEEGFTVLTVTIAGRVFTTSGIMVPSFEEPEEAATTTTVPTTTTTSGGG